MRWHFGHDLPPSVHRNLCYDALAGLGGALFTAIVVTFLPLAAPFIRSTLALAPPLHVAGLGTLLLILTLRRLAGEAA